MTPYWRISLFAMMLASAGLPIYIHLPRHASVDLGLDLGTVAAILLGIRIFDVVQDPLLGRLVDRQGRHGTALALAALGAMALGFLMLFTWPAPLEVRLWLVMALVLVFTGYSLGAILMYGASGRLAGSADTGAQLRLASWRETGLIAGVILAAVAPEVLPGGFATLGWLLAGLALLTWWATRGLWARGIASPPFDAAAFLRAGGGWLLALAVVNSLPVAVTSTLFLFFVEDRLALTGWSGAFLILFFAASGLSIPGWSRLAGRYGARPVLLAAMALALVSFVWAALVPPGAALAFAAICIASGAAIGADLVILPAVLSALLARRGIAPGLSFGLWSFATKLSLPLAAAIVLPLLDRTGFVAGQANPPAALDRLTWLYALFPCALKLLAGGLLLSMPRRVLGGDDGAGGQTQAPQPGRQAGP